MPTSSRPQLYFRGKKLDTSPQAFGQLRDSSEALNERAELRRRFDEDGYLYLPGLLDRKQVRAARLEALRRLDRSGYLDPAYPLIEAVKKSGLKSAFMAELAGDNLPLLKVLYSGPMMAFYENFLGGPVRYFDYTWFRVVTSGENTTTRPHYDVVFMGRGTKNLYTSWTPLGDVPMTLGGLMILENSHRLQHIKSTYGQIDVDSYCRNYEDAAAIESGQKLWQDWVNGGAYADDAVAARTELNGRWLTTDYEMGDLLIFGMYTLHAGMDNQTNRIRLSTDSRYQLASEPVDERWVGEQPIGHGPEGKKGLIC